VAEQFIVPSSFITTSDDDVLNDGAYISETEVPSAGYIVGLTEDSFLNGVGEPSDGYYHGQTVAKITAPISAKVTNAETTSRGHSATSSEGSLRQELGISRPFQISTESEYVLESLGGYVTVQMSSPSGQIVTPGRSAIQSSTTDRFTSSLSPVTSTTLATNDVGLDGSKASRSLSKQSLEYILGTVSGAGVVIICIVYLHRPCYRWLRQTRRGTILIAHVLEGNDANRPIDCQGSDQLEVSRFSLDS
jgi:hypothetical protein